MTTHPDGRKVRTDRGQRPQVPCACGRRQMDYKALMCHQCRNERRRKYYREFKRVQKAPSSDWSPDVIELRFIRALWAKNPRMAQAALARMGRAA